MKIDVTLWFVAGLCGAMAGFFPAIFAMMVFGWLGVEMPDVSGLLLGLFLAHLAVRSSITNRRLEVD